MRQSITPHKSRNWMDQDRAVERRMSPGSIWVESDPYARLMIVRRTAAERRVQQIKARGRTPRVCLYLLAVGGQAPPRSLSAAQSLAEEQGWHVATKCYTDCPGATGPMPRPGWDTVRRQIRAGYVDGVVALTHASISPEFGAYEQQLTWFAEHFGFIALVTPESESAAGQP